jgi:hydrogenase nickel incorporation protein HypB
MQKSKVEIVQKIMNANEEIAMSNQAILDSHDIFAINIMASPGSGKTSLILQTIERMANTYHIAVIEGDTAPVTIDADKVDEKGIPVAQINTGGDCHLDALMVKQGLNRLDLSQLDLLIIENVGNLVCPAAFQLGAHASVVIASTPEGDDKPYKYPGIYRGIDCLVLNKIDLLPYLDFNNDYFVRGLQALNDNVEIFPLSCKTGEGVDEWINWLQTRIAGE